MGGILGGLFDILGGARDLKRQEKEGYDWREKQAQEQFQREQEREEARQKNELAQSTQDARLKGELVDILQGAAEGEEPDLDSLLPQNIENLRRQRIIKGAMGAGKERKSALQTQKLQADKERETIRQQGRLQALAKTQEGRKALQEARLNAGRDLSEDEQKHELDMLDKRLAAQRASGGRGAATGGKPQLRSIWNPEAGRNEYRWLSPGEDTEGLEPGRPATMVQSQGMAQGAAANVKRMEELARDVASGPAVGRVSRAKQRILGPSTPGDPGMLGEILGESGSEGEFDFLGNSLVDTVYLKSGKQINEQEQKILREMIPNRARGNLPEQVRLFKAYSRHLLQKYGADTGEFDDAHQQGAPAPRRPRAGGSAGAMGSGQPKGGETRTYQGKTYWLPPGADRTVPDNWQVMP